VDARGGGGEGRIGRSEGVTPFVKVKKHGQAHAGCGWNQHVDKWTKRYANKVIRRIIRKEADEYR
jgi:hypothetical protein